MRKKKIGYAIYWFVFLCFLAPPGARMAGGADGTGFPRETAPLATTTPPMDVTGGVAVDKEHDDTGKVILSWTPSPSKNCAGYRVYLGTVLLRDVKDPAATGVEIGDLGNGVIRRLKVTAYDTHGNESAGVTIIAIPKDDVPPVITITGVDEGKYYNGTVTPQVNVSDTNPGERVVELNGAPYDLVPLSADGVYTLQVTATDRAGNKTAKSVHFTIDTTPPAIKVINLVNGAFYAAGVIPSVKVTDRNPKDISLRLNGQPYTEGTPVTAEGVHTLEVMAEDMAGNTASLAINFTVDATPPVTSLEAGIPQIPSAAALFVSNQTPITATAQDMGNCPSGVARLECRVDNAPEWAPYDGPLTLAGAAEGPHSVSCRAYDRAGNKGVAQSFAVTVDNAPPVTELTPEAPNCRPAAGVIAATAATRFILTAKDLLSGVAKTEYNVDYGAWQPYTPFTIAAEGRHTVNFKSMDAMGNEEAVKSLAVVIDNTPPTTTITPGAPHHTGPADALYAAPATIFTLNAEDQVAGVEKTEYRVDGERWTNYAPFRIDAEGKHLIEYRSTDRLGNTETGHTLSVTIDRTPPTTTISHETNKVADGSEIFIGKRGAAFTMEAVDALAGINSMEYRIDRGRWTPYTPFTLHPQGNKTISFRSRDNVGNLEEAKTITVRMDKTPPQTTINVGSPKRGSAKDVLHVTDKSIFTLDSSDNESGTAKTEYRIDGGTWTAYSPFSLHGEGKHLIEYRGTDQVGNQEAAHSLHAIVDSVPPVTAVYLGKDRLESGSTVYATSRASFSLSAANNQWGWKSAEYRIDNGPWVEYIAPFPIADEGSHLVEYRSMDSAGNQEIVRSITVVVDNTPPVSTIKIGMPKREADGVVYINSSTILTPAATDNLAGVAKIEYRLAGKGVENDPLPFSIATEGKYLIEYWSTDKSGNQESPRALTVVVNNAAPVIPPPSVAKSEAAPSPVAPSDPAPATTSTDHKLAEQKIADPVGLKPAGPAQVENAGVATTIASIPAKPTDAGAAVFDGTEPGAVSEKKEESKFFEYLSLGIVQLALIVGIMLF